MSKYQKRLISLSNEPKTWLVTGVAGFIGSNLLEYLLNLDQVVIGLDNFATGSQANLDEVEDSVSTSKWRNFKFIKGDVEDFEVCLEACENVDFVLHQAALGSVPRSINDPIATNATNISGFLNMLVAARDQQVKSFTYAASSSTYGDHPGLPKVEDTIGKPLSPYAVTKLVNEIYADVFAKTYNFSSIGLRYFNVFGRRQSPNGAYAAVIPKWISAMIQESDVFINGDGSTSRDFCFIENTIQANILAATANESAKNQVYNCAVGDRTSLNELFNMIQVSLSKNGTYNFGKPIYRDFRDGDVRHSQADISKARRLLGYSPEWRMIDGVEHAMPWYVKNIKAK